MTAQWLRLPRRIYRWTTKRCDGSCKNWVLTWNCKTLVGKVALLSDEYAHAAHESYQTANEPWQAIGLAALSNLVKPMASLIFHRIPLHCIHGFIPKPKSYRISPSVRTPPLYTKALPSFVFSFCWVSALSAGELCVVMYTPFRRVWPGYEPFKAFTLTCRSWSFNQQCIEPLSCEGKPMPNPIAEWQVLVVKMSPCFRDQDVLMYESFDSSRSDEPESWMQPVNCKG